jgi:hypothetical protein
VVLDDVDDEAVGENGAHRGGSRTARRAARRTTAALRCRPELGGPGRRAAFATEAVGAGVGAVAAGGAVTATGADGDAAAGAAALAAAVPARARPDRDEPADGWRGRAPGTSRRRANVVGADGLDAVDVGQEPLPVGPTRPPRPSPRRLGTDRRAGAPPTPRMRCCARLSSASVMPLSATAASAPSAPPRPRRGLAGAHVAPTSSGYGSRSV